MWRFISLVSYKGPAKKRYTLVLEKDGKEHKVSFGMKGAETYIDGNRTEAERQAYLKRHKASGEDWSKINAGSASAMVLWGKSKDIRTNLKAYLKSMGVQTGKKESKGDVQGDAHGYFARTKMEKLHSEIDNIMRVPDGIKNSRLNDPS